MSKLYVKIIKKTGEDFIVPCISTDKNTWYSFPEELQSLERHVFFLSKKPIQNAKISIKNVNGYRTIAIKIDDDIKKKYFDEIGNVCFEEFPLEEMNLLSNPSSSNFSQSDLENQIRNLESQLKLKSNNLELHHIEKKFILDKFDKKEHDPNIWFSRFEDECTRFGLASSSFKIEALRFFVIGPVKDWYENNLKNLGLTATWVSWKVSFMNVFVDKGWGIVRKAFTFKYLGGSLIDYSLAKEKLCIEAEPNGSELSRINQIVFGLPKEVQEKLDREAIVNLDTLYAELRKLEDKFYKKKREISFIPKISNPSITPRIREPLTGKNESSARKPCSTCETIGFRNRYHLQTECRNKHLLVKKQNQTVNELSNNLTDLEILKIESDEDILN